jgi:aryl-alcohol dehydrogenase-like predicted oxidoreductase
MQYRRFPALDTDVSVLGFGAMGFAGWFGDVSDAECQRALHSALELGVSFIDTARAYGESERRVGQALRTWTGPAPVVATKVEALGPVWQFAIPIPVDEAFPPGHVTRCTDESLRRLGRDAIDLQQLHIYWPTWGVEGYWMDELHTLKEAGKVRSVGVSVPDHRADMVVALVQSGLVDSVQTIVNIFDSQPLDVLVPICAQHGVAVIARCILDEGGLTGFLTEATTFPEGDYRHRYFDATIERSWYIHKVDQLRQYVPEHASSLAALAIKFVCHQPGVTTAISSMHVEEHARANAAALDEPPLSEEVFHRLLTSHRFIKNMNHAGHWEVA